MDNNFDIETLCVQAGYSPENGQARILPIHQSTTFKYTSSEEMGKLFALEAPGHFYTRLANPTSDAVAEKIAALEGGEAAVLTSSGQAAILFAIFNITQAGDHIISSASLYGGTYNLFSVTLAQMGIEVTFVANDISPEDLAAAFKPNTKLVYGEMVANASMDILDLELFSKVAHERGVPLIVDNTFPTPINCRPFEWGADIVVHSTTKYMDGHATSVGGCIVDSGHFDWMKQSARFPGLTQPDPSYHGIVYAEQFGKKAYIMKAVTHLMRDIGATPSPMNAFLLNIGLETLHLRVERHCANALEVCEYLLKHPYVSWVRFPGHPEDARYEMAKKYMPDGVCGVLSFGVKGGREKAEEVMNALSFIAIVTHVCDARTSVLHPAGHTHRQLSDEQLKSAGIEPDMIRLSVGIESVRDIIGDLDQAFKKIFG